MTDDSRNEPGGSEVIRALGEELRRARTSAGLTQADLVKLIPSDIHVQTLASYERGIRQCTVGRLIEICRALGVAAPDLLERAILRARQPVDLQIIGVAVDLHALVRDRQPELKPLRQWARNRIATDSSGSGIARIDWAVLQELSILVNLPDLVDRLVQFTPQSIQRRR